MELENLKGDPSLEQSSNPAAYSSSLEGPADTTVTRTTTSSSSQPLFRYNRLAVTISVLSLLVIAIIGGGSMWLLSSKGSNNPSSANSAGSSDNYAVSSLPLQGLKADTQLQVGEADHLSVNGQLKVSNTLVVSPTATPTSPVTGQIYYDQKTNQPYYYNGTAFVSLAPTAVPQHVTSIGGVSGVISVGNGLQVTSGQLGLTSAITQKLGQSSGSGVSSLTSGTSNLVITNTGNGNYTLSDNSVVNSGSTGQIALITGAQTIGGSILSQSGSSLTAGGTLTVSGGLLTNSLQQTAAGNNVAISAGSDSIVFTDGSRTFAFPAGGGANQTICTTGVTCASGGGIAVLLQPGAAQADTGAGSSIFVNNTGGGNLLELQGAGSDRFVVTNGGNVTAGGTLTLGSALTVANGGTGDVSLTANGVLYGNGAGAVQATGAAANSILATNGSNVPGLTQTLPIAVQSNITTTGILATGSIASGFGAISTSNNITTSAALQGGTLSVASGNFTINSSGNVVTTGTATIQGAGGLSIGVAATTAGSLVFANASNGHLTTLQGLAPAGQDQTITIPASSAATDTVCLLTLANCVGAGGGVTASGGTQNFVPKFTNAGGTQLGNSLIFDNGTSVGVNNSTPGASFKLDVGGNVNISGNTVVGTGLTVTAGGATVSAGGIAVTGNSTISGTLTSLTGLTSSGTITFSGLNTVGVVHNSAGGVLSTGLVALGTDTSGNYVGSLGSVTGLTLGGTNGVAGAVPTLAVNYGALANTAVQGNTTLICPSGTGNLTGGGNTITLGSGGSCNNLTVVNSPTFTGTLSVQGGGGISVGVPSTTDGTLVFNNASNAHTTTLKSLAAAGQDQTITIPASSATTDTVCLLTLANCVGTGGGVTSSGGTSGDIAVFTGSNTIGNSILSQSGSVLTLTGSLTESGALTVQAGGANITGNSTITGTLAGLTGLTSSGTITFSGLSSTGVVHNSAAGVLSTGLVALGTDTSGNYVASLGSVTGLTIGGTNGVAGAIPTLTVAYGSSANTAVQGNTTLVCPSGTGNLTGGGNTITLGSGGSCNGLDVVSSPTFSGNLAVQGATGVTIGSTTNNGALSFLDGTSDGFTGTIKLSGAIAASKTYNLPNTSGASDTICLQTLANCAGSGGGVTTSGGTNGTIALFTGSSTIANSILTQSSTTLTDAGNLVVNAANGFTGNLLDLQVNGSSKLSVDQTGALTVAGSITANTLQHSGAGNNLNLSAGADSIVFTDGSRTFAFPAGGGANQTICTTGVTCASGGGVAVLLQPGTVQTDSASGSSIFINNTGGGNLAELQGAGSDEFVVANNGTTTIGGTLTVKGASATIGTTTTQGSLVLNDGNGASNKTATLQSSATLGQNTTYTLPDPGSGAATICLSTGNCAGSGGGLTGSGTTGALAVFNGTGTLTSSASLSESGSTVTSSGNLVIQGTNSLTLGKAGPSGNTGSIVFQNATNANTVTLQSGAPAASFTLTLPATAGNNGDCLESNGSGTLSFQACTGGAGGGVTSLDSQTGVLSLSNSSGSGGVITIDDAKADGSTRGIATFNSTNFQDNGSGTINTIQDIATTSSPTFGALTLQASATDLNVTGAPAPGTGTTSLIQIGGSIAGGNSAANGGTYIGINEPNTGAGSAADFFNFEHNGTSELKLSSAGALTEAGALTVQAGGANITGNSTITGTLTGLTGLTSSGTVTFSGLSSTGVVHNSAAGVLSTGLVALGTDTSGTYIDHLGSVTGLTLGGTNNVAGAVPTLSVIYGSSASTAAEGDTALSFTGSGNLTGTVSGTAGGGITTNTLAIVNSPTFSGGLTVQGASGITVGSTANNGALSFLDGTSDGFTGTIQLGGAIAANKTYNLPTTSGASDTICLLTLANCVGTGGGVATTGGAQNFITKYNNAGATQITNSQLFDNGTNVGLNVSSGFGTVARFTVNGNVTADNNAATQVNTGAAANKGLVIQGFGTGVTPNQTADLLELQSSTGAVLAKFDSTGALTAAGGTFTNLGTGVVHANSSGALSSSAVVLGTETSGSYVANLGALTGLTATGNSGAGSTPTLSVTYGSGSNTAVQGNVTVTCPTGTGNLNGGGDVITLGSGGTCSNITITNSPTFSGTLAVQGAGGITVGVAGTTDGALVLANASNSHLTTLKAASSATQDQTVTIPASTATTDTVCLQTLANCVGTGGGVAGSGTSGTIAVFTGTNSIGNSILSQSGTTLTVAGNQVVNAGSGFSGNLIDLQVNGSSKLSVDQGGNLTGGLINGQTISSAASFTGTLAVTTLGATTGSNYLCYNTSNQIASCSTTGSTGIAFVQGGNSFGATAVLGTTDANSLSIGTFNGTALQQRIGITNTTASGNNAALSFNGTSVFQPTADSTAVFQVQNAAGTGTLFNADTSNMRLGVDVTYTAMTTPSGLAVGAPTAGGSLAASTTYFYEVTAIGSAGGETVVSNEASGTTDGSGDQTLPLTWTAVTGASGYKVYRGTTSGSEVYLTSVLTNSFTDSGSITIGTGSPPSTSNAYISTNVSNNSLQLSVGGNGTPTGQVYVSGTVPSAALSTTKTGTQPYGLAVQGNYTYVLNLGAATMSVYDTSNPASPQLISTVATGTHPFDIHIQGHFAYVINNQGTHTLQVFDISNPYSPTTASSTVLSSAPCYFQIEGDYLYVIYGGGSVMNTVNISNPYSPTILPQSLRLGSGETDIVVQGRYLYAVGQSGFFDTVDISNPGSPVLVGTTNTGGSGTVQTMMTVQGRYAYVSEQNGTTNADLVVVDISNPTSPVKVSAVSTGNSGSSQGYTVSVQGRYAYVENYGLSQLQIFDVSNPSSPWLVGSVSTKTNPADMVIQGRYAYLTNFSAASFQIFDLGGTYTQTLQAGSAQAGSLQVDGNTNIGGNATIQGGLGVANGLQVAGPVAVSGSLSLSTTSLSTPTTPTLTSSSSGGTLAAATYYYKLAAISTTATTQAVTASPASVTTSGTTSANTLTWSSVSGATGYVVYRSTNGTTWFSNVVSSTTTSITDDGSAYSWTSSASPLTITNGGGNLTVGGQTTLQSTINNTSAVQIQNASGSTLFNADTSNMRLGVDATYTAMSAPAVVSAVAAGSTGTLAAGNYYYAISAMDSAGGETTSTEFAQVTVSATNAVTLTWTPVTGAASYRIYRTAVNGASGSEVGYYITNGTYSGGNLTFTDTGATQVNTTATPRTSGTAYVSSAASPTLAQLNVGGLGMANAQLYVGGVVPSTDVATIATGTAPKGEVNDGHYIYVINSTANTLQVFDATDPAAPALIGTTATGAGPNSIAMQGRYVYVANTTANNVQIFDISNPSNPVSVGTVSTGTGPIAVTVANHYVYVTNNSSSTMQIIDISNPLSPVVVGSISTSSQPQSVVVQGRYAFVGGATGRGFQIFDISNPSAITIVSNLTLPGGVYIDGVQGRYAYVSQPSSLYIYDISNPYSPQVASITATTSSPGGLIQGRYFYYVSPASGTTGFRIYDISNPSQPALLGSVTSPTSSQPRAITINGHYAYVLDSNLNTIRVYDLGGAYVQAAQIGSLEVTTAQVDGNLNVDGATTLNNGLSVNQNLQVSGNSAFNGNLSLTSSAISDPSAPTLGSAATGGSLAAGTYYYRLAAVSPTGTTKAVASSPTSVTTAGTTSVNTLTWSAVTGSTGYVVYRTSNNGSWFAVSLPASATSLTDDGTTYSWTISAGQPPMANTTASSFSVADSTSVTGFALLQGGVGIASGIVGGTAMTSLTTPAAPSVNAFGTTGAQTWGYKVVAVGASGVLSSVSAQGSNAGNGVSTLTGTNYEQVSWTAVTGAVSYKVYRTQVAGTSPNPSTTGLIGTTANTFFNDTGLAGDSSTPAATTVGNLLQVGSAATAVSGTQALLSTEAASRVGLVIQGSAAQTADLMEVQNSSGTVLAKFDANGILGGANGSGSNVAGSALTIAGGQGTGTANGGNINFQIAKAGSAGSSLNGLATVFSLSGTNGAANFQNATNSTTAFQIQNASAATLLNVDSTATSNLITNGDFEGAGVTGWSAKGSAGAPAQSSAQQWQGNNSLSETTTAAAGDGVKYVYSNALLTNGQNYNLSFYLKLSSGTWTNANMAVGRADDGATDTACVVAPATDPSTTSWTRYSCSFTAGVQSGSPYIFIKQLDGVVRTFFIDGVQLQSGSFATAFNAGGAIQLSGIVNSPVAFQNKVDSTTAFQIQGAGGTTYLNVNTLAGSVTLGTPSGSASTSIFGGSAGINIGTGGVANTIQIGNTTGAVAQTIDIGNNATASSTNTVVIGSTVGSSALTLQGGTGNINLNPSGASNTGVLVKPGTDSTAAFKIQNAGGSTTLLNADTTNTSIGIAGASTTAGYALNVTGAVATNDKFYAGNGVVLGVNATTNLGAVYKVNNVGTGGVSLNDITVLNSSDQVVETTTPRDPRVYGVAVSNYLSGNTGYFAISGNYTVNVTAGAVNIGDQLVTSSVAGQAMVDNNATTGIIGYALTSKAGGSAGTVSVFIRPVNGVSTPDFRPTTDSATAFQLQNAASTETLFTADTTARSASGGNLLKVGNSTGTDTATTILQVDAASSDPTSNLSALNGGLYYNSTTNHLMVIENGIAKQVCNMTDLGCGSTTTGAGFVQNGNSFGAPAVLGTTDANTLTIGTYNGTALQQRINITNTTASSNNATLTFNGASVFKPTADSTTAFQVQNAAGTSLLTADTSNNRVTVNAETSIGTKYGGNNYFTDNFESGNMNLWSSGNPADGITGVEGTVVHNGAYALGITDTGGTSSGLATSLPGGGISNMVTYFRAWVNVTSQTTANVNLFRLNNGNNGAPTAWDIRHTTGNQICVVYESSGTSHCGGTWAAGSGWHEVELEVGIGTNQATNLWLDGTSIYSSTADNNGTVGPEGLQMDINNDTVTYYTDDLYVGSVRNSTASSLNVSDSLSVQGNSTFDGEVMIQAPNAADQAHLFQVESSDLTNLFNVDSLGKAITINATQTLVTANGTNVFQVQNTSGKSYLNVNTSGAVLSVGNTGIASTIQIGNTTGAVTQTIGIGNNATASSTTTLTVGSTIGSSSTKIQGGSGGILLNPSGVSSTGVTVKPTNDSTTAFQIQDATAVPLVSVDTANDIISLGASTFTFPNTPVLDNFNRAGTAAPPSASWSADVSPAGLELSGDSNTANASATGTNFYGDYWNPSTFGPNTEIYATVANQIRAGSNEDLALYGRLQNPTNGATINGYEMEVDSGSTNNIKFFQIHNGSFVQLSTLSQAVSVGDSFGLRITGIGATVTLEAWYKPAAGSWGSIGSTTDSGANRDVSAGNIALEISSSRAGSEDVRVDNFGGGTLTVPATQTINIGANTTPGFTSNVVVGSTLNSSALTLQGGTTGVLVTGANSTTAFQVQDTSANTYLKVDTSGANLYVGNLTTTNTINVGNNTIAAGNTETVSIATSSTGTGKTNVTIGSTNDGSTLTLQSGTGNLNLNPSGASNTGVVVKPGADSTAAFQIQNASGGSLFNIDSSGSNITLNGADNGQVQSWQTGSSTNLSGRASASVVIANGFIYEIGGLNSSGTGQNTVQFAKLGANGNLTAPTACGVNTWCTTTALPTNVVDGSAVYANGYIYVTAGDTNNTNATSQSTVYYGKVNQDGTISKWNTNANTITQARNGAESIVNNGYLYVIGGLNTSGATQNTVYYTKLNADGSTGGWSSTNTLSAGVDSASVGVANGYVYVVGGGAAATSVQYAKLNTDGTTSTWATSTVLPNGRKGAGIAINNGYLYIIGGYNNSSTFYANTFYAPLNSATGTVGAWSCQGSAGDCTGVTPVNGTALPATRSFFGETPVSANGYTYVISGTNASVGTTVYYTSTARTQIAGSLDLVGLTGQNLSEGGSGGQLTAGNTGIIGTLNVQNAATFNQSLAVGGTLTVGGDTAIVSSTNSTTAFQVQNTSNVALLSADTSNMRVSIGTGGTAVGQLYIAGTQPSSIFNNSITGNGVTQTVINGRYAYVSDYWNSQIKIYDVSNPASPTQIGSALALGGGLPISLTLAGHYLYIAENTGSKLQIVDVSNPNAPSITGTVTTTNGSNSVAVVGHYAYVGQDAGNGVDVIDVVNPAKPVKIANIAAGGRSGQAMMAYGRYVYVLTANNGTNSQMQTIDTTTNTVVGTYTLSGGASGNSICNSIFSPSSIYVQGRYAFVANCGNEAIDVFDVSNPTASGAAPVKTLSTTGLGATVGPMGLVVQGRLLYAGLPTAGATPSYLATYDISTISSTSQVGTALSLGAGSVATGMTASGRYLYLSDHGNGVVDIFDMGGTYSQQLMAGGIEASTLQINSDANIAGNTDLTGSLQVGQSAQVSGSLGVNGTATFANTANSTTAFQIQNATNGSLFNVDSSNNVITLNGNNSGETAGWVNDTSGVLPAPRSDYGMAAANGYIYIVGGQNLTQAMSTIMIGKVNADGSINSWKCQGQNSISGNVDYCGAGATIANTNTLPAQREDEGVIIANGYIYAISGDDGGSAKNTVYHAKLNADGSTGAWTSGVNANVPSAEESSAYTYVNGYIYMFGGFNAGSSNAVYYAKPGANGVISSWTTNGATMPLNNLQEQALTDNGYIYLVGNSPSSIASRDVWYTRPNADGSISSFSTQTNALPSANKVQAAAVAANGYLYTYGGYSTSPSNNTTSLYYSKLGNNGTPGTWATSANTLPASRSFLGQESVTLNGYIYAIGGEDTSSNATTTVYRASLSRIQVAGSLDLVGTNAQNLADGNSGGELTAGNTNIVGTIQATGNASFLQNVSVNANLTVQGDAYIGATLTVGGNVTLTTGVVTSGVADGATAIAHTLNTSVSYATSGDLLLAVENNGVKEFSIDRGGHIITGGSTPTATVNTTDAGTGATCTISGDDTAGQVTIATGTGTLLSGTECAITYATSFANTPVVILSSANGNASGRNIYSATSGDTTTGFDISFGQAPFSGTYIINYIVIK